MCLAINAKYSTLLAKNGLDESFYANAIRDVARLNLEKYSTGNRTRDIAREEGGLAAEPLCWYLDTGCTTMEF